MILIKISKYLNKISQVIMDHNLYKYCANRSAREIKSQAKVSLSQRIS